jgi:hypothetical protein
LHPAAGNSFGAGLGLLAGGTALSQFIGLFRHYCPVRSEPTPAAQPRFCGVPMQVNRNVLPVFWLCSTCPVASLAELDGNRPPTYVPDASF